MDVAFTSIEQLATLLRRRSLSAVELVRESLERLDTVGRAHGAVVELLEDRALDAARRADGELARGHGSPLTGIPFGVKDLLAIEGASAEWGSHAYPPLRARRSAAVIRRLEAAGAVLVARLSMMELAGAGGYQFATASSTGPCLNPWDKTRWSGGSSSGSAAAVASGCVPFAIGSETGGSVVIPAAFCGVTGLRPSWGAVSRMGGLVVAWSLDKMGPIGRSAADVGLVLNALAGREEEDPLTWRPDLGPTPDGPLRLGVLPFPGDGYDSTRSAFAEALVVLADAGHSLRDVELPDYDYRGLYDRLHAAETAHALRDFIHSPEVEGVIDDAQRAGLRAYRDATAFSYVESSQERSLATPAFRSLFDDLDALVAPTLLSEATTLETDLRAWPARRRHYAVIGAVTGVPGVTVPMGLGEALLPLGLSVISDRGHDRTALAVADSFQQRTAWHRMIPIGLART